jgi:hypothetical protein
VLFACLSSIFVIKMIQFLFVTSFMKKIGLTKYRPEYILQEYGLCQSTYSGVNLGPWPLTIRDRLFPPRTDDSNSFDCALEPWLLGHSPFFYGSELTVITFGWVGVMPV